MKGHVTVEVRDEEGTLRHRRRQHVDDVDAAVSEHAGENGPSPDLLEERQAVKKGKKNGAPKGGPSDDDGN